MENETTNLKFNNSFTFRGKPMLDEDGKTTLKDEDGNLLRHPARKAVKVSLEVINNAEPKSYQAFIETLISQEVTDYVKENFVGVDEQIAEVPATINLSDIITSMNASGKRAGLSPEDYADCADALSQVLEAQGMPEAERTKLHKITLDGFKNLSSAYPIMEDYPAIAGFFEFTADAVDDERISALLTTLANRVHALVQRKASAVSAFSNFSLTS